MSLSFHTDPAFWFFMFTQWQTIAMMITIFVLLCKSLFKPWYERCWIVFPFRLKWVLLAAFGVSLLFIRELFSTAFPKIQALLPYFTFTEQLVVWMSSTHLRSILFFAVMIFYLWRKYDALLPAMAVGWFALGVVELSYIPQLYISTGGFIGLDWYYPFIGAMILFIVERKRFQVLSKGFLSWFTAGLFFQYYLLAFRWAGLTLWDPATGSFPLNPVVLPVPPWETWMFEFLNHLVKTLWAVAFCYTRLRKEKPKQFLDPGDIWRMDPHDNIH